MPYLKTITCHTKSVSALKEYLENGTKGQKPHRVLGWSYFNLPGQNMGTKTWDMEMDRTRHLSQNDKEVAGRGRTVTFRHFILSPKPTGSAFDDGDDISPEQMMDYAKEWVRKEFGDDTGPGLLGQYETAIALHNDSVNHNLHAHIVVNNTNLITGRRMQISNKDVQTLTNDVQELAIKRGWHYLDYVKGGDGKVISVIKSADQPRENAKRTKKADYRPSGQKVYQTASEKHARAAGKRLWKDDLRQAADLCAASAIDINDFIEKMAMSGYRVEIKNDELLYHHSFNPDSRKCYGGKLGRLYTIRGVESTIKTAKIRSRVHPEAPDSEEAADITYQKLTNVENLSSQDIARMVSIQRITKANDVQDIDRAIAAYKLSLQELEEGTFMYELTQESLKSARLLKEHGGDLGLIERPSNYDFGKSKQNGKSFWYRFRHGLQLTDEEKRNLTERQMKEYNRNVRNHDAAVKEGQGRRHGGSGSSTSSASSSRSQTQSRSSR